VFRLRGEQFCPSNVTPDLFGGTCPESRRRFGGGEGNGRKKVTVGEKKRNKLSNYAG